MPPRPHFGPRTGPEGQASYVLSQLSRADCADFRTIIEGQQTLLDRVLIFGYYHHTLQDGEWPEDQRPGLAWEYIGTFYSGAETAARDFLAAQEGLLRLGRHLVRREPAGDDFERESEKLMLYTFQLVRNLAELDAARAKRARRGNILSGPQQRYLEQICERMGTTKPPNFLETLRRYLPRFVTHGEPLPAGLATGEEAAQLERLWAGVTPDDVRLFTETTPGEPIEKIPIHLFFQIAEQAEREGHGNLGYKLRTWVIGETLDMEDFRSKMPRAPEIPFFKMILAGQLTGQTHPLFKGAYFDLPKALVGTMGLTLRRLEAENQSDEADPARQFLGVLRRHYPQLYPEMVAKAVLKCSREDPEIDAIKVFRVLSHTDPEFEQILAQALKVAERTVLTESELAAIAGKIPFENQPGGDIGQDIAFLTEGGDLYRFKTTLAKAGIEFQEAKADIQVELDASSRKVYALLTVKGTEGKRSVSLQMDFEGRPGSVSVETIAGKITEDDIIGTFKSLIAGAVAHEVEKKMQSVAVSGGRSESKPPPSTGGKHGETRAARMEAYLARRQPEPPEEEDAGTPTAGAESKEEETSAESGWVRTIGGLEPENVSRLLKEGGAEKILAPDDLIQMIKRQLEWANSEQKPLGKKLWSSEGSEGVDLRQLKWQLDSGRNQIRVYLVNEGGGTFRIIGVLRKVDSKQQQRFIEKLIKRIREERGR